jgi:hypothetical protein
MIVGVSFVPKILGTASPILIATLKFDKTPTRFAGRLEILMEDNAVELYDIQAGVYGSDNVTHSDLIAHTSPSISDVYSRYSDLLRSKPNVRDALWTAFCSTQKHVFISALSYADSEELSVLFLAQNLHGDHVPEQASVWMDGQKVSEERFDYLVSQQITFFTPSVIPVLYSVISPGTGWEYNLTFKLLVEVGKPAPICPHSSYFPAAICAEYEVYFDSDIILDPREFACRINVSPTRLILEQLNPATFRVKIFTSSFGRFTASNLLVMRYANATTFRRSVRPAFVEADPPMECPKGYYYMALGGFEALPLHAEAGEDCYGVQCEADYDLIQGRCVSKVISSSVIMIAVFFVLSLILTTSCIIMCCQVCKRGLRVDDIMDDREETEGFVTEFNDENDL